MALKNCLLLRNYGDSMDKVNYILKSLKYNECLTKVRNYEADRIFCKHDLDHFLDVARIAYIMVLEEKLDISKEIVYATALLHDIGRFKQYEDGTPHHEASYKIAEELLKEAGFDYREQNIILEAIIKHRNSDENQFNKIFYRSDKLSRDCYNCKATLLCNWNEEKRNMKIIY